MADASDSKSDEGDLVWVQVPSPASSKGYEKDIATEKLWFYQGFFCFYRRNFSLRFARIKKISFSIQI